VNARSAFDLRRPIPVTLAVAIAIYVIVPTCIRSRAEARFSQCQNLAFQHSGSHVSDVAYLDEHFNVICVASCPSCSHPDAELGFVICESGKPPLYGVTAADIPPSALDQARVHQYSYKATPRYRALRKSFSHPHDVAFRDVLLAQQQAWIASSAPASSEIAESQRP